MLCVMLVIISLGGCKKEEVPEVGPDATVPIEVNDVERNYIEVNGKYEDEYVVLNYVPEGYILTEKNSNKRRVTLNFERGSDYFTFGMCGSDTKETFDTENAIVEELWINGNEAVFSFNENVNILVWNSDDKLFNLSSNISQNEMIKIAENAQNLKNK